MNVRGGAPARVGGTHGQGAYDVRVRQATVRGVDVSKVSTRRRTSARRTRAVGAAGAVLLVGALTACSGGQPGAAAVVDGDRVVPVSDVDSATRELADVLQGVTPAAITQVLVQEPVITEVAEDEGVGISPDQVDDFFDQAVEQAGLTGDPTFGDASRRVARFVLARTALQNLTDATAAAQAISDKTADMKVDISPRYGSIGSDGVVGATTYDWLVPVATDEGTAAP